MCPPRVKRILSILFILTVILALTTVVYMVLVPWKGDRFTEFFLLGENGTASLYPVEMVPGRNYTIYLGIGNHEYRAMDYTLEIWGMDVRKRDIANLSQVTEIGLLDRIPVQVAHGKTVVIPYNLSVEGARYNRIEFLLFRNESPGPPHMGFERLNSSYRRLNLWVTVRS
jgi:uncharacterized membrane protein